VETGWEKEENNMNKKTEFIILTILGSGVVIAFGITALNVVLVIAGLIVKASL